ncbi:MAG: hypothetical protein QXY40_09700 [Candidatus Methanomethylicia archaeon]
MEKTFKAIIIYAKKIIPRPHGLVELYSEVKNILHVNPSIESNLPGLSA